MKSVFFCVLMVSLFSLQVLANPGQIVADCRGGKTAFAQVRAVPGGYFLMAGNDKAKWASEPVKQMINEQGMYFRGPSIELYIGNEVSVAGPIKGLRFGNLRLANGLNYFLGCK